MARNNEVDKVEDRPRVNESGTLAAGARMEDLPVGEDGFTISIPSSGALVMSLSKTKHPLLATKMDSIKDWLENVEEKRI